MGEEEHQRAERSKPESGPITHEPIKNIHHLAIPEKGRKCQPSTPISSDIVSNISMSPSEQSERSAIQTIEVAISTATSFYTQGDEDGQDDTMAARKRERSPPPRTKRKERIAKMNEKQHRRG